MWDYQAAWNILKLFDGSFDLAGLILGAIGGITLGKRSDSVGKAWETGEVLSVFMVSLWGPIQIKSLW